jgi:hypothetical protein
VRQAFLKRDQTGSEAPSSQEDCKICNRTGTSPGLSRRHRRWRLDGGRARASLFTIRRGGLDEPPIRSRLGRKALDVPTTTPRQDRSRGGVDRIGPNSTLTVAVSNAGIAGSEATETLALEKWRKVHEVNVAGVFLSYQAGRAKCWRDARARSSASPRCRAPSSIEADPGALQFLKNRRHPPVGTRHGVGRPRITGPCRQPGYTLTPMANGRKWRR